MEAKKIEFENMPEIISVPKEFINKKAEIIFILENENSDGSTVSSEDLISFFRNSPAIGELNLEREKEIYNNKISL